MKEKRVFVPRVKRDYIGTYIPRTDALQKASGTAPYAEDLTLKRNYPDMVYMKMLKCPYPHATIKSMDTSKAEALPGVVGIIRYDDPEVRALPVYTSCWTDSTNSIDSARSWGVKDRHYLWDTGNWAGEEMGVAVAAETVETCEEALALIEVEWEEKPFVLTIEDAVKEDAPIVHPWLTPDNNFVPRQGIWLPDVMVDKGDVEKAFAEAYVTAEAEITYRNPQQCALDYWNCLMIWGPNQLLSISDTYGVDQSRLFLSEVFGLPLTSVRCISPFEGGQHGRANTAEQQFFIMAAMMSKRVGRPVRYTQTRKEHFHDTRTEAIGKIKLAADKDGKITACDWELLGNSGAYSDCTVAEVQYVTPEWMELMFGAIPNQKYTGRAVYTNIIPASCMRSIGNIELNFLFGLGMDILAEKLGVDPLELYKNNITCEGVSVPNECVTKLLDQGAELIGWQERHESGEGPWYEGTRKRGIGFSLNSCWHTEYQEYRRGPTQTMIKLNFDGTVILNAPTVEVGGGSSTCATLTCADTLGVPYENVTWIYQQDTETGLKEQPQTDSAVSYILSECVHECALEVKDKFLSLVAKKWNMTREELDMKEGIVFEIANPEHRSTIKEYYDSLELFEEGNLVPVTVLHTRELTKDNLGSTYLATFAEVEVDTETGEVEVLRMVVCSDGGTVLFPAGAEGQLVGGQCQGLGEALYEEMIYDEATGIPLNFNFVDYKFPTMADFPEIDPVPMEIYKGVGEFGSSGMGESAPCCTPRAIANAIYNAIGVRMTETAMNPAKILKALGKDGE